MVALSISQLNKTYQSGFKALSNINLEIRKGELFALLGPNGAGKTTLISVVCGIVTPTSGTILAGGHDIIHDYRAARQKIGLVPQELTTDAFESVWATVNFSRRLFGYPPDPAYIESILRDLSLLDKRDEKIMRLSGGMKRRVLIAKALSHQPEILFLDEPTAGVDVKLRREMWALIHRLRERGVTIILTTHYIEEAEDMADRIGVIRKGELILVEEKNALMKKLGKKQVRLTLQTSLSEVPVPLRSNNVSIEQNGEVLVYTFNTAQEHSVTPFLRRLEELGIAYTDIETQKTSLEQIFVELVDSKDEVAA